MAKDLGWIKLHRNSFNNPLYFAEPFTKWQAWADLLLLANHKDGVYFVRGVAVNVPRGCVGFGLEELSKRWKWSRGKVERYMQFLESKTVNQIVRQKTRITTLISILNYDNYQSDDKTDNKTDGHQTVKQTDINKNVKNDKKEIKEEKGKNEKSDFGVPAGLFSDLYEKMMFEYMAFFPTYYKDDKLDYPACNRIARKIEILKGWDVGSSMNGKMVEFLKFWSDMSEKASKHKWLSQHPLSVLEGREWQKWCTHMANQELGTSSKDKKSKKEEGLTDHLRSLQEQREAAKNKKPE